MKKVLIGVSILVISSLSLVGCGSNNTLGYKVTRYTNDVSEDKMMEKNIDVVIESEKGISSDQAKKIAHNEFDTNYAYSQINIMNKNNEEIATVNVFNSYQGDERNDKKAKRQFGINVKNEDGDNTSQVELLNKDEAVKLEKTYTENIEKSAIDNIKTAIELMNSKMDTVADPSKIADYDKERSYSTSTVFSIFNAISSGYMTTLDQMNYGYITQDLDRLAQNYMAVMENMYYECSGHVDPLNDLERENYNKALKNLTDWANEVE